MPRYSAGISPKQERFRDEYIKNGGNATQAVIDAGYKCANRHIAQAIGTENLLNPVIAGVLATRKAEICKKSEIEIIDSQLALVRISDKAEAEGKFAAAVQARHVLLKSIGGMTGDRPHPDSLANKALDAKRIEALREAIGQYYADKYLAKPVVSTCKAIEGQPEAAGRPTEAERSQEGMQAGDQCNTQCNTLQSTSKQVQTQHHNSMMVGYEPPR